MSSCGKKAELPQEEIYHAQPGERIEGGFSYTATEGAKVIFEVEGERATGLSGNTVHIEKPEVTWYSRDGLAKVKADEGVFMKETEGISFEGNVSITSTWGRMNCDKLDWSTSEKKMTAQGNARGEFYLTDDSEG